MWQVNRSGRERWPWKGLGSLVEAQSGRAESKLPTREAGHRGARRIFRPLVFRTLGWCGLDPALSSWHGCLPVGQLSWWERPALPLV